MIEWTKSPVWLVEAFDAALPDDVDVERRQMFGYPAAFVGGNMATGLFQEQLIVRLPEERRATLLAEPGSLPFEPMPGRAMKEYVVVSPALVSDARELKRWIAEAAAYAASLPARAARTARKSAKRALKKTAKATAKKRQPAKKLAKASKTASKAVAKAAPKKKKGTAKKKPPTRSARR
jgi:TfoX/Sxy family transcriptional regulator of competence genes